MANSNLHGAKKAKNDEFYTRIQDIEKELKHYRNHFKGKSIFLNCDDPEHSEFWKFFELNFDFFGLRKLTATHFDSSKATYKLEMFEDLNGDGKMDHHDIVKTPLKQNGDFRSSEAMALLNECDIVVTNPPFSLFREYMAQLVESGKKFLVVGNNNSITYKDVFQHIKSGAIWLGVNSNVTMSFQLPDHYEKWKEMIDGKKYGAVPAISWFTNLEHHKRNEEIILYEKYTPEKYPTYDNYDAIEVSKVKSIPKDYKGAMGVPITFLTKFNPKQFEIIGIDRVLHQELTGKVSRFKINSKEIYARIVIKARG